MAPPLERIAFYGSLMRRAENRLAEAGVLPGELELEGDCLVPGELYHLGSYPGLVEGNDRIPGELYRIQNPAVLAKLDRFEEVDQNLYHRQAVELIEPKVVAWVYFYNGDVAGRPRLAAWSSS
jgi:gamma-glutamylcyclotransferase (GGCT)/AIG2-like uncharacterized protein YtfP